MADFLNLGIVAFSCWAVIRTVHWLCVGEYPAAWCWFALALLGIPAVLMGVEP